MRSDRTMARAVLTALNTARPSLVRPAVPPGGSQAMTTEAMLLELPSPPEADRCQCAQQACRAQAKPSASRTALPGPDRRQAIGHMEAPPVALPRPGRAQGIR